MIDNIDLEQYKIYKEYYEKINKEICKLCCIPKDYLNENVYNRRDKRFKF